MRKEYKYVVVLNFTIPTAALKSDSPENEDLVCSCNNHADQVLTLKFVRFLKHKIWSYEQIHITPPRCRQDKAGS